MTTRFLTIVGFAAFLLLAVAMEAVARTGRTRLPTLDAVFASARRSPLGRAITFAVWFWFGWHFLARGS